MPVKKTAPKKTKGTPKKAAVKKTAAKKPVIKKTAAKKPTAKKVAAKKPVVKRKRKEKKGDAFKCRICGYRIIVDEVCGCVEEHVFMCCEKAMKKN
jgi:hypothetical protein